jgi:hypothetical protein
MKEASGIRAPFCKPSNMRKGVAGSGQLYLLKASHLGSSIGSILRQLKLLLLSLVLERQFESRELKYVGVSVESTRSLVLFCPSYGSSLLR